MNKYSPFVIQSIITIQLRFRVLKLLKRSNYKLFDTIKNMALKMLINLSSLHNKKVFVDTPGHYNLVLNKIKKNILELKSIPKVMTFKNNLKNINDKLYSIDNKFKECLNHITPDNFHDLMEYLTKDPYFHVNYDTSDMDFINKLFKPIMVWDSEFHKIPVEIIPDDATSTEIVQSKTESSILATILGTEFNTNKITNIIKKLSKNKNNKNSYRKNHFTRQDLLIKVSEKNKIFYSRNTRANSMLEELNGIIIYIKYYHKYIAIQGYLQDDILSLMKDHPVVSTKLNIIKKEINYNNITIHTSFRNNFLDILSLKDILTLSPSDISSKLSLEYNDYKNLSSKPLLVLINDFLLASKTRKKDILLCLLLSDNNLAATLFDTLKQQSKTNLAQELLNGLPIVIRNKLDLQLTLQEHEEEKLNKITESDIPYEKRIHLLDTDETVKFKAMEKLKSIKTNFQGDSKAATWLDGLLKIPFGTYRESPILTFKQDFIKKINKKYSVNISSEHEITNLLKIHKNNSMLDSWKTFKTDSQKYLGSVRQVLDEAVFGHNDAKTQIERVIGQWINGNVKGAVLGLQGPPGTGKTSLAVKGLSKCLKDSDGTSRPFAFLPIGGSSNGSTLVGHNFTYVGSTWGRIVDILITTKCMNPIIFIDEIDKVSRTEHGKEIISILTHLTDSTQNHEFEDKYFAGIKFDLSKALIIFSFNDVNLIDPILQDRITIIDTHPLTLPEKITISKNFVVPEILKEIGFGIEEIIFSDDIITYLIETYTFEAGVRKLKEKYYEIIREINLRKIHENDSFSIPYTVEKTFIENLFNKKPKMRVKTIHHEPKSGLVNGLYATTAGIGGLTVIQVLKHPSDKNLDISMTGKQGEVMKESVNYAFKIAFGLLPFEKQKELINQEDKFGLHIHTPEAAVPKDGPSAGAAITLAFYSILTDKKVNNKVAMTGEIDLLQNVTAIGGLGAKLLGAKRAGATKVLIPQENEQDLERLRLEGISPEDDDFVVIPVSHFSHVLEHALIE